MDSKIVMYALIIIVLSCLLIFIFFIRNRRIDKKLDDIDKLYKKGIDPYSENDVESQGSPIISEEWEGEKYKSPQKIFYETHPKTVAESFPIKPKARVSQKIYHYKVNGIERNVNKVNYTLLTSFESMRLTEQDTEVSRYTIKQCCEKNKNTRMNINGKMSFVTFSYTIKN